MMQAGQGLAVRKQGSLLLGGQGLRPLFEESGCQGCDISIDSRRTAVTRALKRDMHRIVEGIQDRVNELITVAELQLKPRAEFLRRLKLFGGQEQVAKQISASAELARPESRAIAQSASERAKPDNSGRSTTPTLRVRLQQSATANTRGRFPSSAAPHRRHASEYARSRFALQYFAKQIWCGTRLRTGAVRIENNVSKTALSSTRTGPPKRAISFGRAKR